MAYSAETILFGSDACGINRCKTLIHFGYRRRTIIDQSTAKFYKLRVEFLCRSRDARVFCRSEGGCMLGDGLLDLIEQFGRISGLERQRTLR
jgi:hypothetical protein